MNFERKQHEDFVAREVFGLNSRDAQKGDLTLKEGEDGIFLQEKEVGGGQAGIMIAFRTNNPEKHLFMLGALIAKSAECFDKEPTEVAAMALAVYRKKMALNDLCNDPEKGEFFRFLIDLLSKKGD